MFGDISGFCHHVAMTLFPVPILTTSGVSRYGHMCPGGFKSSPDEMMAGTHELQKVGLTRTCCLGVINLRGRKEVMFIEHLECVGHCAELSLVTPH